MIELIPRKAKIEKMKIPIKIDSWMKWKNKTKLMNRVIKRKKTLTLETKFNLKKMKKKLMW